jgi:predicted permease
MAVGAVTNYTHNWSRKFYITVNFLKSLKKQLILTEIIMTTFLGVLLFAAIFAFVLRTIRHKDSTTTLPYNAGTGVGNGGSTGNGDTGKDEDKFKI